MISIFPLGSIYKTAFSGEERSTQRSAGQKAIAEKLLLTTRN